jgi:hypothetical protein
LIEIQLTDEDYVWAEMKAKEQGELPGSIRKGEGNRCGYLGERAVLRVYGGQSTNTKHHDILLPDGRLGEVKSKSVNWTKKPRPFFDCSVTAQGEYMQACDIFIFTRINEATKQCWLVGHCDREYYKTNARFVKVGTIDPINNWKCKRSTWNLPISMLEPPLQKD